MNIEIQSDYLRAMGYTERMKISKEKKNINTGQCWLVIDTANRIIKQADQLRRAGAGGVVGRDVYRDLAEIVRDVNVCADRLREIDGLKYGGTIKNIFNNGYKPIHFAIFSDDGLEATLETDPVWFDVAQWTLYDTSTGKDIIDADVLATEDDPAWVDQKPRGKYHCCTPEQHDKDQPDEVNFTADTLRGLIDKICAYAVGR